MRMSRTVLGGALGETPEVYSLHEFREVRAYFDSSILR